MKISIIIPAKGQSQRVKNKNVSEINGKTLVRLCCEKILKCENINKIYLDTNDEGIIKNVSDLDRINIIKRPTELANNSITANDLMVYGLHSISECDLLLQTFVTSPLITYQTIDRCIKEFLDNKNGHDSFFTVTKVQEYFWDEDSNPINFNHQQLPNSFELEPTYMETHGLYGIYIDKLIETKRRVGNSPMKIEIPKIESFDIDDYEDLTIVKRVYEH